MEKFGDPEFLNHATAARLYTIIAMRAASADVAPFRFVPYGLALREHVDELRLIHARRARQEESAKAKAGTEFEGVPELVHAILAFQARAEELDRATEALSLREAIAPDRLTAINDALLKVERAFLFEEGLPGRPWFKHAVYAPGLTTGYAAWPLPAIRQAIEDKNPAQLAAAISKTVDRIRKADAALEYAKGQISKTGGSH